MREQALAVTLEGRAETSVVLLKSWEASHLLRPQKLSCRAERGRHEHVADGSWALTLMRMVRVPTLVCQKQLIPGLSPQRQIPKVWSGSWEPSYSAIQGILRYVVQGRCFESGVKWAWIG